MKGHDEVRPLTLDDLPAELLERILSSVSDEIAVVSAAAVSQSHGLGASAHLRCMELAAHAAERLGLAWAAGLPVAAGMFAVGVTSLPPTTVLRLLSLEVVDRLLSSELLWIAE